MQEQRLWGYVGAALTVALLVVGVGAHSVYGQSSSSPNYEVVESEFGSGSLNESCSTEYCGQASIGEVGQSSSAASPELGEAEYSEPTIEMVVSPGESNLGTLTTERTATKTTEIQIRNYLSGGYTLLIVGDPPSYGDHVLATPSVPTTSTPGQEQFGMNIVRNTTLDVGADPVQVPADEEVFGEGDDSYNTPDFFMYQSGDVFAHSASDTGGTNYTISMIVNISNTTPSGHYGGDFTAVIMPAY